MKLNVFRSIIKMNATFYEYVEKINNRKVALLCTILK